MKLTPLHDQVVVTRNEAQTESAGGIIIPENIAEKPDQGTVIAVGAGRRTDAGDLISMTVKVGDLVLFSKSAGQPIKVDGEEVIVLREGEIFAIVTE